MTWVRKPYDPNNPPKPRSERQIAQQQWLTVKGQAISARETMKSALYRCGLSDQLKRYHLKNIENACFHIMQAADRQWEEAQIKYPKKVRKRKTPRFVTNNYWESEE